MRPFLFLLYCFAVLTCSAQPCKNQARPVVFVHGFLASGDTWATQVQRFSSNGFCEERLFAFDWNTIGGRLKNDSLLDVFIDDVLKKTKATQVDLAGHSAGGGLCYTYLKDSLRSRKVAHYVHIGSNKMKAPAGPGGNIPTMNIYSIDDKVVRSGGEIPGAVNIKQTGYDHLQTATAASSFLNMYNFFTGDTGKETIVRSPGFYKSVKGKGVMLGENTPLAFDSFRVFLFNPATGRRYPDKRSGMVKSYTDWAVFDKDGKWGFALNKESYTEFEVRLKNARPVFYYFEPPVRDNHQMYIRALPATGMAAAMLKGIPNDDTQTTLIIFTANQAVISGRDTLAIDSIPLSLPALTPAGKTAIASFVFDDGDGISSRKPLKSFASTPFLSGVDIFIPADDTKTMRIYFNGRSMVVPRRKSSEGLMVVVFN
jgi:pimeloyl-ACP methyl ester carboxylesterase